MNTGMVMLGLLLFTLFSNSLSTLLPGRARLKSENGHLILEGGTGKNISLNTIGNGGAVRVNGVDIIYSYNLIKAVTPALETLRTSDLNFLIGNLSRVVEYVSSESHLAQVLDDAKKNISAAKADINLLKSSSSDYLIRIGKIETNLTNFYTLSQSILQQLGNSSNRNGRDNNGGGATTSLVTRSAFNRVKSRVTSLEITVSDLETLEERVTSLELSSVNGTSGGSRVNAGVTRDVRRLKRQVTNLKRWFYRLKRVVFKNDCASDPCHNGATCIDTTPGFFCLCPPQFEGTSCSEDINECLEFVGTDIGCQNGATCTNAHGSYTCTCAPGFYGVHCTQKTDSCTTSSSTEICGHGTCISTPKNGHQYSCICDQGWTKSIMSPACVQDVDECALSQPPCSHDPPVQCINTYGSFRCGYCPQGYEGNGFVCRDIDECASNNGGCSLLPRVECINTRPSRRCGPCPPGYSGNGITCYAVSSPCSMNPCHPMATCQDNPHMSSSYYTCTCPYGYTGNGMGPSGCMLTPGSGGGGGNAVGVNPCSPNPCVHGTCSQYMNQYTCTCYQGYSGTNCYQMSDMCSSSPCMNGGTCTASFNSFICSCPSTHSGDRCQTTQLTCGGRLTGHGGVVDYPGTEHITYPHNISCAWVITVNRSLVINVNFSQFHLEQSSVCSYDWLQIHDGPRSASHMIGRFCGTNTPGVNGTFNSTHNHLYLWFRSDHSYAHSGFTFTWNATEPVCGKDIRNLAHGAINSPGYPGRYPADRDCYWTIQVNPGKKIQFAFATLQIETHPNCSFDYLAIRDGLAEDAHLLDRFCSSQIPSPVITSGSEALIHFHSDHSESDTGFHVTFASIPGIPGCGGLLTGDQGEFSVPTLSNEYEHNLVCEWKIRIHPGARININFTAFNVEHHRSCRWDFVEVREGGERDSPLIGRFCGNELPSPITSNGNNLFIIFKSDSWVAHSGFTARYQVACGGEFTAETGTLKSPYHPQNYPHNRVCIYNIRQPIGKAIELNFTSFDLEDSYMDCRYDYIEIRDGISESSPLMGKYCGPSHKAPAILISSLNGLWIKFKTDGSISNKGFTAIYSTIDIACGGIHHELAGTLSSPNSPDTYPGNTDCRWVLDMPLGYIVQLTWNSFALEHHSNCNYDYIEVFDNSSIPNTGGRIGGKRYCGSSLPPVMTTFDNVMTIHFHSDSSSNFDGFSAAYHAMDASRSCGGKYHLSTGRIASPNYPGMYPNRRKCIWTITVPVNSQIKLNFTHFDLENGTGSGTCFDYLKIKNGGHETSPIMETLCGENRTIAPKFSHSHELLLDFSSDSYLFRSGFELFWTETATGCGGTLTSVTGEITSPGYPSSFHRNAECFWKIQVNEGFKISLHFVDLDLVSSGDCYGTYVEVLDGTKRNSRSLGTFCTSQGLVSVNSTGNEMMVKFKSGWSAARRGFKASYFADCNNVLTGPNGVIESPNFPNPYPHNRNCTWIIKAPRGNSINITFSHFEVEDPASAISAICEYDFVEVRVGHQTSVERTQILHKCGSRLPQPLNSGTGLDVAEVQFVSDSSVAANGFRLEWIVHGCGGVLHDPHGIIESPNYPNAYPVNMKCEWHIRVYPGLRILFRIPTYDIEGSFSETECTFDALEIYGGIDRTSPRLLQICHNGDFHSAVTTQGSNALVTFESDGSVRGKGFQIRYNSLAAHKCGGWYGNTRGEIASPNYPDNYDHHSDCLYKIYSERNHVVELEFTDFNVEPHTNCSYDYVKVYDGLYHAGREEPPLLLVHCGSVLPSPAIFKSTTRFMTVRLKADESSTGKGFKAKYRQGCGATIDVPIVQEMNALESPNFPRLNSLGTDCMWHLKAPTGYKVTLTFAALNIQVMPGFSSPTNSTCTRVYVAIYDGDNDAAPEIKRLCGTHLPLPITSTSEYITVHLKTFMGMGVGFRVLYSSMTSVCGGDLSSISGEFASPNYPDSYPTSYECIWTIHAGSGNKLRLNFLNFDIEENENCNFDYLEIHERNLEGKLLLHNCSSTVPSSVEATESLWVKFRSDDTGTAAGFLASYSILNFNELYGSAGEIASPLYPQLYTGVQEFSWLVRVPRGQFIAFSVMDLAIEVDPVEDTCFSSLVIHQRRFKNSPVARTLCGYHHSNEQIEIASNAVLVRFISNFRHEGSMFKLRYKAINYYPRQGGLIHTTTGPNPNCSFVVYVNETSSSSYAQINSPNYPENYDNNEHCQWIIRTNKHMSIVLWYTYILEGSSDCIYDSLEIFDGIDGTENWNRTAKVCGRSQTQYFQIIRSSGSVMKIVFKTDSSVTKKGFMAYAVRTCGGVLTEPEGVITSPNYPENYYRHNKCSWRIKMRMGRTITFIFDDFHIKNESSTCIHNHLIVYNGGTGSSPFLGSGRYCGGSAPIELITSSNLAFMKFETAGTEVAKGFKITYHEVSAACGGTFHLSEEMTTLEITSPNYPHPPHPHTECTWIIFAPEGKNIALDFIDTFHITSSDDCENAYVEVREGATSLSKLLARYCGDKLPNTVNSRDNIVSIKYYTNSNQVHTGFKVKAHSGRCGGTYRLMGGLLSSPNFPAPYDDVMNCSWHVVGPPGHYLKFYFTQINIYNPSEDCSSSIGGKLTIRDNMQENNTKVLCSEGVRYTDYFETVSFNASILFTNNLTTGVPRNALNRFQLIVYANTDACGGTLSGTEGSLQSPGYPLGIAHGRYCEWKIISPPGTRIQLTFDDMDLGVATGYCYERYVLVFNGAEEYSPYIDKRICREYTRSLNSSMNSMKVIFKATKPSIAKGFKASWTTIQGQECGGVFSTPYGSLQSPGYETGGYNHSLFCEWTINNPFPGNSTINIHMDHIALEDYCYDYIMLQAVLPNGQLGFEKKICHREPQVSYTFPYPTVKVTFISDFIVNATGFNITYNITSCGGYHSGGQSNISSPLYPQNYPANSNCIWLFDYREGIQVEVNFTDFRLENSLHHDFVKIFNGPEENAPLLGHYTGTMSQGLTLLSMANDLKIAFKSDSTGSDKGFSAAVRPHTAGCGGIVHGLSGDISSPGFSNGSNYGLNIECIWEIRISQGYMAIANFVERFDLETSENCINDFVQVSTSKMTDGVQTWELLGKYCGKQMPPAVHSNTSIIQVKLKSNQDIQGRGFKIRYSGECGGIFEELEGIITSPNYPEKYPKSIECLYKIKASEESYVTINFTSFNVERSWMGEDDCSDSLEILQKHRYWSAMSSLKTLCGREIPDSMTLKGDVYLRFKSNNWTHWTAYRDSVGFMAKYSVSGCGGNITQATELTLPDLMSAKSRTLNCLWDIKAPDGKVIKYKFQELTLPYSRTCSRGSAKIYNGLVPNEDKLIATLCGRHSNKYLPIYVTDGATSRVSLKVPQSRWLLPKLRVSVSFQQKCGLNITITDHQQIKTIRSVDSDGDGQYEPSLNCRWLIRGLIDSVLSFNFTRLDLEGPNENDTEACPYDFVKIFDGPSSTSPLIGTFCGSNLPSRSIVSAHNIILVEFISDSINQTAGFTAKIKNIPRLCGSPSLQATNVSTALESPNYPANYPLSIRCVWTITAPENGNRVLLTFDGFQLQQSQGCTADNLFVSEYRQEDVGNVINTGEVNSGNILSRYYINLNGRRARFTYGSKLDHSYCGNVFDHHLTSTSKAVRIEFNSDATIAASGFRLHYELANCNTTYEATSAVIKSRSGREPFRCNTLIQVHTEKFVTLYFTYVGFYNRPDTHGFYMKVYDESSKASEPLTTIEGYASPNPIYSDDNTLFIESVGGRYSGYTISYATSDQANGCGGEFFGDRSIVTSPNYPGIPERNLTCIYTVAVQSNMHAAIRMRALDFGGSGGCNSTYLEVYDVLETNELRLYSTICPTDNFQGHISPTNRLVLRYVTGTTGNLTGTGWRATVRVATPGPNTDFSVDDTTPLQTEAPPN